LHDVWAEISIESGCVKTQKREKEKEIKRKEERKEWSGVGFGWHDMKKRLQGRARRQWHCW